MSGNAAVDFTWGDGSTTLTFTYSDAETPVITAPVEPTLGGSAGGTILTITGTGFM